MIALGDGIEAQKHKTILSAIGLIILRYRGNLLIIFRSLTHPPHPRGGSDTGICPKPGKSSKNTENTIFFAPAALFLAYYHNRVLLYDSMPSPNTIITKKKFLEKFRYSKLLLSKAEMQHSQYCIFQGIRF